MKHPALGLHSPTDWVDLYQQPKPATSTIGWRLPSVRLAVTRTRIFDIVVGICLLLISAPCMLLVAALIRFESKGPIFYRQVRVGQFGRTFVLTKFRSMTANAEAASGPCWARREDPRVTRVGRIIRLARIDELPQLFDVLRGDMSIVGPRPERPHFVAQLVETIPGFEDRTTVKPGLTGWAQINYPYGASVHDARMKLSYDLYYIKNKTFLLDLRILLATVPVVLLGWGAR